MKTRSQLLKWGTVAALGLAIAGLPAYGADPITGNKSQDRTTTSDYSRTDGLSSKMLGHVEPAKKLIGKEVLSSDNQKVGKLENLIVDLDTGKILYGVIGSGGILGAGEKKFAVAPRAFNEPQDDSITLKVDKAKLQGAPQFTSQIAKDEEIGTSAFVTQVHQYFAQDMADRGATAITGSTRTSTEYKNVFKADDLIGLKIKDATETELGKVDNLAIDLPNGHVVYVIMAPESKLKSGAEYLAVPPSALLASADRKALTTDLSKEKFASAPHFAKDNWANLSDRTWASQVYQYYGKRAYFDMNSRLQPTGRTEDKTFPNTKN